MSRAMSAMGGRGPLGRVKAIGWTGKAHVIAGERVLDLGIETRVEPFVRARSRSWILAQGEASARTLLVDPDAAFVERGGKRTPLPYAQAQNERQQYGVYGYMLLALAPTIASGGKLLAAREGYPPIAFDADASGRINAATYVVAAADGGAPLNERFIFTGSVSDHGIRWPAQIDIAQNGAPFFSLKIDRLMIELRQGKQ